MDALAALAERLPEGAVSTHPGELSSRSRDAWPLAMLREARGERLPRPMAVVFPRTTEDVAATLAWAAEAEVAVVPRGAGSGVCGGAQAVWRGVVVDLAQMNRVLDIDEASPAVRVEAGIRGDRLEAALAERGLTLGHYPQSAGISTVGGWIATSSAGQASAGYGAIEDLLLGLVAVLAGGAVLRLRPAPRSAAGPDLRRLLVGSEGTLAIVTEATLAVARASDLRWVATRHATFEAGLDVAREIVQGGFRPTIVRLYDEPDATVTFGVLGHDRGAVLVTAFADRSWIDPVLDAVRRMGSNAGADELEEAYGRHWWDHRHDTVDQYRRIMGEERMLGPGVVVDTVEVAGLWSRLPALYRGVRDALAERAARPVTCHLSHPYPAGASLYFTVLLHGDDDRAVEQAYAATWRAAAEACHHAGGTISHHHGIGLVKTPFMRDELGDEGLGVLRSIKDAIDPAGVLNPGKLIPAE